MNRHHAEPERGRPVRCSACGLPFDEIHRQRLEQRCENTRGWRICPACLRETCDDLVRVCAEEADAAREGAG